MTKFGKLTTLFGIVIAVLVVAGFSIWFFNTTKKITTYEECIKAGWLVRSKGIYDGFERFGTTYGCVLWSGKSFEKQDASSQAIEVLRSAVDVANELSGITSGAVFTFEVDSTSGRFANFGITQYLDEVRGKQILEERAVTFRETGGSGNAEVDPYTNQVVAMHRSVPSFASGGDPLPIDSLEATARQFVKRVYPEFSEGTLEFDPGSKSAPEKATNHFFRWNDKQFAVPDGLDMDIPPFIQVGINSNGFIFSYGNTVLLYHDLPKEVLRTLCGFIEMPRTDDSSLDPEKGIVKVRFDEYEPVHQGRYLILPYEPETDFEGCSESAKEFLRHLPNPYDKN